MARNRNTAYNTVHHLTSRIAHQAFFLGDDERNDFTSLMTRVSEFSGVELLGWCIMNNHFHIYVYLPTPPQLTDDEVLERYHLLKGDAHRLFTDDRVGAACQALGANSDGRVEARAELVRSIRRQMYSIAEYMRMVKQWFTDGYNERSGHKGTMWEAPYGDRFSCMPERIEDYADMRDILVYIHLNPIRAAITNRFDGYRWSSYSAFKAGDPIAMKAMHRVYPDMSDAEIVATHELRMTQLLESCKRERADDVARKRLAGYKIPLDPLTDECMVAQSMERMKRIQQEVMQLQLARKLAIKEPERRELICRQIVKLASIYPDSTPQSLSAALEVPIRTIQRYVGKLLRMGVLHRVAFGLSAAA